MFASYLNRFSSQTPYLLASEVAEKAIFSGPSPNAVSLYKPRPKVRLRDNDLTSEESGDSDGAVLHFLHFILRLNIRLMPHVS